MRFGVREIANMTFRPLQAVDFGDQHFEKYQPCLFIDTATTSTIEGAATTVYAQGGRGNARLVAWEGERTVTITVTDSLISPISFAMLSGANLADARSGAAITVHAQYDGTITEKDGTYTMEIPSTEFSAEDAIVENSATGMKYAYAYILGSAGAAECYLAKPVKIAPKDGGPLNEKGATVTITASTENGEADALKAAAEDQSAVRVDYYVEKVSVKEITVDAENFAGYYYIEADTLFRDEATGADMPANFIIPRGKIQSNFTFTLAATGDPSTFDFTIDAFPAYTRFSQEGAEKRKVLFALQVVGADTDESHPYATDTVKGHKTWDATGLKNKD